VLLADEFIMPDQPAVTDSSTPRSTWVQCSHRLGSSIARHEIWNLNVAAANGVRQRKDTVVSDVPLLEHFPLQAYDKLRYADTDRQGHVNNAVFATALETGRVELLYAPNGPLIEPGQSFVIARLELDFRGEMTWPGEVAIGTAVKSVGRTSFTLQQALYQTGRCIALARTVIVQIDDTSHRPYALSGAASHRLRSLHQSS
jgi:acyl-CoA thioester hydrolase